MTFFGTSHTQESVKMAEAISSSYGENQSSSKSTTDSDSSDDEYNPDSSTASASGRSKKLYYMREVKWLKRNKKISRQERRRIQQEIQKGRKPGEPTTSLLSSLTPAAKRDWCQPQIMLTKEMWPQAVCVANLH